MRKLIVCNRLSIEKIDELIRKCVYPKEITRWIGIRLMKRQSLSANQVAKELGFSPETVRIWVHRYNRFGEKGLKDGRINNKRGNTFKNAEFLKRLSDLLKGRPSNGGIWVGRLVQKWVEEKYGAHFKLGTIYSWMHEAGYTPKVPRPSHIKSDKEKHEEFKKKDIASQL